MAIALHSRVRVSFGWQGAFSEDANAEVVEVSRIGVRIRFQWPNKAWQRAWFYGLDYPNMVLAGRVQDEALGPATSLPVFSLLNVVPASAQ